MKFQADRRRPIVRISHRRLYNNGAQDKSPRPNIHTRPVSFNPFSIESLRSLSPRCTWNGRFTQITRQRARDIWRIHSFTRGNVAIPLHNRVARGPYKFPTKHNKSGWCNRRLIDKTSETFVSNFNVPLRRGNYRSIRNVEIGKAVIIMNKFKRRLERYDYQLYVLITRVKLKCRIL